MAFFGKIKDGESKDNWVPEPLDLELLAIGKRTGLSFAEINELEYATYLLTLNRMLVVGKAKIGLQPKRILMYFTRISH